MSETKQLYVRMLQRFEDEATWNAINPILGPGEMGVVSNSRKFKVGDGRTPWCDLDYQYGSGVRAQTYNSTRNLPPAAEHPGEIAIVPQRYIEKDENNNDVNVTMDTPYISLKKNGIWYWTIFADQKDKPIASSALDYFQLDISILG